MAGTNFKHLAGRVFGALRVTRLYTITEAGHAVWHTECTHCGEKRTVRSAHLLSGATRSCKACGKEREA